MELSVKSYSSQQVILKQYKYKAITKKKEKCSRLILFGNLFSRDIIYYIYYENKMPKLYLTVGEVQVLCDVVKIKNLLFNDF
jgi:hypothetical protein